MKIILASHNKKKLAELSALLSPILPAGAEITDLDGAGIKEEIEETGSTFEENAYIKAKTACGVTGCISIADDSGLMVDALGGEPGVYSARYSGGGDAENNKKLLSRLCNTPDSERSARFVCAMACVFPDKNEYISVRGSCEGIILRNVRGEAGFGYDPLFYYPPLKKTFAELTQTEKSEVSHRKIASRALAEALKTVFSSFNAASAADTKTADAT